MTFDRRNFIGFSMAAASVPALAQGSLLELISGPNAVQTVHAIVKEYLQVGDDHLNVVARFTASLQSSLSHTEAPEEFSQLLRSAEDKNALSNYIVQEFVISTNYLAFMAKEDLTLKMLA